MSNLKKQWWSLRWNLALLICLILLVGGVSFHFLIKEPITKKVVQKEFSEMSCPFLSCYQVNGWTIYYEKHDGCCHKYDIIIPYKTKRETYILRHSAKHMKEIFGGWYYRVSFKNGKCYIGLDYSFNSRTEPKDNTLENYINEVTEALSQSENEVTEMFCTSNSN